MKYASTRPLPIMTKRPIIIGAIMETMADEGGPEVNLASEEFTIVYGNN